jgi:DeoR family suf operon transcriptional repressor
MALDGGRERRRGPTRRQILTVLCGGQRTANELAEVFGISGAAIRDHLRSLGNEGTVRHRVERRGVGKPTHVYELTSDGFSLLSKAYVPVLGAILSGVVERDGEHGLNELLERVGRSLAAATPPPEASPDQRAQLAATAIEELGGIITTAKGAAGYSLQGGCCPLAPLSERVPSLCRMLESMLRELTGMDVHERCDRSMPPRCHFEIPFTPGVASGD